MPILMVFAIYGLHRSGVCISQLKSYRDEDVVLIAADKAVGMNRYAVDVLMNDKGHLWDKAHIERFEVYDAYEDGYAYLKENPRCCEILENARAYLTDSDSELIEPSVWDILKGNIWDVVKVDYRVRYKTLDDRILEDTAPEFISVNICGRPYVGPSIIPGSWVKHSGTNYPLLHHFYRSREIKP